MAGLMYFLPDVYTQQLLSGTQISRALLEARGLADVLADRLSTERTSVFDLLREGPGGRCGAMIVPLPNSGAPPVRLMFEPHFQDWIVPFAEDQYWIGLDRSERPRPEDLERMQICQGYPVELADGQRWHVPVIRRPDDSTQLPRSVQFDAAGRMRTVLVDRYREMWQAMAPAVEFFCAPGEHSAELEAMIRLAIRVLGVNYRYSLAEQNVLGLVDTTNWQAVLEAAIDWPLVEERLAAAEKKSGLPAASPPASTPPGCAEDCRATVPAMES